MARKTGKNWIVGVDVGTSKVTAVVGETGADGTITVIGHGVARSHGLKRGVVVNIESTIQSIQQAVELAETDAGCQIHSVFATVSGSHVGSRNSHGIVGIKADEVTQEDVDRVVEAARAVAIPADQELLHILPQEFVIDDQEGIKDPIGMSGVRLEGKIHLVTGSSSSSQNLIKCLQRCALDVDTLVLQQLASALAVLTEDEKELGVCLVDAGSGTTSVAIYTDGALQHTAVVPIAGDQVTNDIAVALRTPVQHAENVKVQSTAALRRLVQDDEEVEVPSVGDRPPRMIPRGQLAEVAESRYEELFRLVRAELRRSGLEELVAAGVVLTGGAAKMEGVVPLAEEVFEMPVRLGTARHIAGSPDFLDDPAHAAAAGLLLYGREARMEYRPEPNSERREQGVWQRFHHWLRDLF